MEMSGRCAVITGGASGLGAATAQALADNGMKVALIGRRAEPLEEQAKKTGGLALPCDVRDADGLSGAVDEAAQTLGPPRLLVNCAGVVSFEPVLGTDDTPIDLDHFREVMDINVTGTVNAVRLAAAYMKKSEPLPDGSRGLIVNVSSIAALDSPQGTPAYVASKGAIAALTLALARDFGDWGIRVVGICPGPIRTAMIDQTPPGFKDMVRHNAVFPKDFGAPENFAQMVVHLWENPFINGTNIRLDAGIRAPYMSGR